MAGPDPRPRVKAADSGEGSVVVAQRCTSCRYAVAHPRPRCPECGGELAVTEFGPGATVWASTVVHVPVAGLTPPYGLAYVDLDDDGPRVLAHTGTDTAPPVGARVRLGGPDERGNLTAEERT